MEEAAYLALGSHSDQLCKVPAFKQINKQTNKPVLLNFSLCPKDITKYFQDNPAPFALSCQSEVNYTPVLDILKHHLMQNNFLVLRQYWEVRKPVIALGDARGWHRQAESALSSEPGTVVLSVCRHTIFLFQSSLFLSCGAPSLFSLNVFMCNCQKV